MKLGKSQREKDVVRVASVALVSREGRILFGHRGGGWCMPGGHLNPGEAPLKGALRELLEETGIKPDPDSVEFLGSAKIAGKNLEVFSFRMEHLSTEKPSGDEDPDGEFDDFKWVAEGDLPEPLYNKKDVTLQLLGWQPETLDLERADLSKASLKEIQQKILKDKVRIAALVNTTQSSAWKRMERPRNPLPPTAVNGYAGTGGKRWVGNLVVGPNTHPNKPPWRVTYIDSDGTPTGHSEHRSHEEALKTAIDMGADIHGQPLRALRKGEEEDLVKSLGASMLAIAAGAAMHLGSAHASTTEQKHPIEHTQHLSKWTPKGLHPELHPIAMLETRFGQDMNHKPHSNGSFETAFGAVGLKPMTGHEEYKRTPNLKLKYPNLEHPADFEAKFHTDHQFYNEVASAHWHRLRKITPNLARAAYSWRFGLTAQKKATNDEVASAEYVKQFKDKLDRMNPKKVKKSEEEPLDKMALKDLKVGKKLESKDSTHPQFGDTRTEKWDYSHILSPEHRAAGYSIKVEHSTTSPKGMKPYHNLTAYVYHPSMQPHVSTPNEPGDCGQVEGLVDSSGTASISNSLMAKDHRGKGLGLAMYEAFYRHAMKLGAKRTEGGEHSSSAASVHARLAEKHGLAYEPYGAPPEEDDGKRYDMNGFELPKLGADYDGAEGGYDYTLKSEDLGKMALSGIPVGAEAAPVYENQRFRSFDYSHLLSPEHKAAGYGINLEQSPDDHNNYHISVQITHPKARGRHVGGLAGHLYHHDGGTAQLKSAFIVEGHRGKGLGSAAYEAFLAHVHNHLGAQQVQGGDHSSMAAKVHKRLAAKHGLAYEAVPNDWAAGAEDGPFDKKAGGYKYALKSELDKAEKKMFRSAGFRHKTQGHVVETGQFHNIDPWLVGGSHHGQFETCPAEAGKATADGSCDWEAGFITHDGKFMNREEAGNAVGLHRYNPISNKLDMRLDSSNVDSGLGTEGFIKAEKPKVYKSKDGITIPASGTPERKEWDTRFHQALVTNYGNGDHKRLKKIKVPIASIAGSNMPVNKDRLQLYRKMAKEDVLPPVVVRRVGTGFYLMDGNHRHFAAKEANLSHLDGVEVLPFQQKKMKKSEPSLDEIHDEFVGEVAGFKVWIVKGSVVRDHLDIDFTNGGNHSRYDYVPEGEIWITREA